MDLNKLSTADRVIGISAIVFLIAMFLPWYGLETGLGTYEEDGWDYFLTGVIPLLLAIVMVAQIALAKYSTTKLPEAPLPWNQVHLIAGAAIAVLLVLRTLIVADRNAGGFDIDLDRMYGLFVALIAALGLGVGGFLKSKEPQDVTSGPGGYPDGGYPPPPPGGGPPRPF